MDTVLTYRGRNVSAADIAFIRELIAGNPGDSRRRLSKKLREAWNWRRLTVSCAPSSLGA
ncbi:MAG: hypothetical protein HYV63_30615 [Candidatus Schekmanbacteria bacterium]|nr:hypothetical protein [Candidatus Schekmanbacteria bacterium]